MLMVVGLAVVAAGDGDHALSRSTRPPPGARHRSSGVDPLTDQSAVRVPTLKRPGGVHEFYFTRARYGSGAGSRLGSRWQPSWATDYPKADIQFLIGLKRLTNIDAYEWEHPVDLDDPELRHFPFLYALEVGYMGLSESEVTALRSYLLAGGFLMIDDFWGTLEWENFEKEIGRVLPGYPIVELPRDHPVFSVFYDIGQILQVPNVGQGRSGGPTWEKDGYVPHVRGIFDENGRLLVVINWNTDLGDAWEWADDPYYPIKYSTFAYEMGINTIIYAMSH
jgi:Domain of unknown function (DUF4159)